MHCPRGSATRLNEAGSPVIVDHSISEVEVVEAACSRTSPAFAFATGTLVDWMFALEGACQWVKLFSIGCGLRLRIKMRWYHCVLS